MFKSAATLAVIASTAFAPAAMAKQHRSPVRTNPTGWVKAWEIANDAPFYDAVTHAPKSGPLAWIGAWEQAHPGVPFYTR